MTAALSDPPCETDSSQTDAKTPPPPWVKEVRFAAWAAWISVIITSGANGIQERLTLIAPLDFLIMGLAGGLFVFACDGIVGLLWTLIRKLLGALKAKSAADWMAKAPASEFGRILGAMLFVFGHVIFPDSFFKSANAGAADGLIIAAATASGALVGFVLAVAKKKGARVAFSVLACAPLIAAGAWLAWPGSSANLIETLPPAPVEPLALENPGLPGPYTFTTLTYGSGTDRLRDEFAEGAALITEAVDGTPIYAGFGKVPDTIMRALWGFDFTALPINGRVWMPEGDGPFPLVLIVHGNHTATDFSDTGYDYLAEHLATQGYIAVSVDENFINGTLIADGQGAEMPLRAWLLLKHLAYWRGWNANPDTPFYNRVDMDNIALIGHSRGGEAVVHAADMNTRLYSPISQVSDAGEFEFGIRAVVAIAPIDGMFWPAGDQVELEDVSYLTIDGAHDADTDKFYGLAQYNRTGFTGEAPDAFKAAVYFYRSNHGQFNSTWRYGDLPRFDRLLLNRAALMSMEDQQAAAQTFITGFLNAALRGETGYQDMFASTDAAHAWLPDEAIITQYQGAGFIPVDTNHRLAIAATEVDGGEVTGEGLETFAVEALKLRDGERRQDNSAIRAAWEAGSAPALDFVWPQDATSAWALTGDDSLTLMIGPAADDTTPANITITLETADGISTSVPLADFVTIQPPFVPDTLKSVWFGRFFGVSMDWAWEAERVMQTCDIPLAAFLDASPDLSLEQITGLRIEFDGSAAGDVYVDDIGFSTGW